MIIRQRRATGATLAELAREFRVSIATIFNATTGISWKHVTAGKAA